ncbi:Hpt domain-containing protein [Xylophilus sp. GOD-11R]|uniref:hybrid sensor histidine kinase/response regulator n=1 Tax=Xylophilus sp. GOD-11R TaxID=3089814 RepID=UPI00298D2C2A|nr:Hpt domain-containing protein [Xylophilus sp. GOD-11R]WPB57521.1 Hpt domain-containing protein [Xylophilus sp. GOD-11R]
MAIAPDLAAPESSGKDIGPLAWIAPELRRQIDAALKGLRRFQLGVAVAGDPDAAAPDTALARAARHHLHQAAGALEMVGMRPLARLVGAMEAAAQQFAAEPQRCDAAALSVLERCAFALGEFLDAQLAGKHHSAVGLFPQYRELQALAGVANVHPAELWDTEAGDTRVAPVGSAAPLAYGTAARAQFDQKVLAVVKTGDPQAARMLAELSQRLAAGLPADESHGEAHRFWQVCAAFFEAQALDLLPHDLHAKRIASRVLMQYPALVRGDAVQPALLRDLLFFCAHARRPAPGEAPALDAVRQAWAMPDDAPHDYERPRFGRFDPALLSQARKRIANATESWAALTGGDRGRLQMAADQFELVADSLRRLHPSATPLADALGRAMAATLRAGRPPGTALAMEVATSLLYLQAAYETLDTADEDVAARAAVLAGRLDRAGDAAVPEPLDAWMEELYRHVSERQTMGSVVEELRASLHEAEHSLDLFFRAPQETAPLLPVPNQLTRMRGVLAVLGLEQAAQASVRMRDQVERLLVGLPATAHERDAVFDALGSSLGALGFLIDMLAYQPMLARRLFVFDEARGVLRSVMARLPASAETPPAALIAEVVAQVAAEPVAEAVPEPDRLKPVQLDAAGPAETDGDDELRTVFLDEAREVIAAGLASVDRLDAQAEDLGEQTALRRAFHTLKGSARMVGLDRFGEAAWAMEQLLNSWLAEQDAFPQAHRVLARRVLDQLGWWVADIAAGTDGTRDAAAIRQAADALRFGGEAVVLPDEIDQAAMAKAPDTVEVDAVPEPAAVQTPDTGRIEVQELDFSAFTDALADSAGPADALRDDADAAMRPARPPQDEEMPVPDIVQTEPAAESWPEPAPELEAETISERDASPSTDDVAPPDIGSEPESPPESSAEPASETQSIAQAAPEPVTQAEPVTREPDPVDRQETGLDLGLQLGAEADEVKVIDSLRIPIPLYNIYLNEADEWSRRLLAELGEWALELHRPLPASASGLAHSLAGSSATVGFESLAGIARLLEQALDLLHGQPGGTPHQAGVFVDSAEDIRRLLHQFAAGFLKQATPRLLRALQALIDAAAPADDLPSAASFLRSAERDDAFDANFDAEETAEPPVAENSDAATEPDRIDPDLFPIFEEEALDLLPKLGGALRRWSNDAADDSGRQETLRLLHTLKGSARLAGAVRLGDIAHAFETDVEAIGQSDTVTADDWHTLFAHLDAITAAFDTLRSDDARRHEALAEAEPARAPSANETPASIDLPPAPEADAESAPRTGVPVPARAPLTAPSRSAGGSVRVRAGLLDRLVNEAGEVIISRSRLESRLAGMQQSLAELTGNLDRLRGQLRDVELQAESQMQSRLALGKESAAGFDPLEFDRFTRVQELTRMMAESVDDVATVQRNLQRGLQGTEDELVAQGRQARELQRDLLRTRMVEFDSVTERLHATVRQTSRDTAKSATLEVTGGSVEMDRGLLDRLMPAFEHLLRNAVVHGIETPAERQSLGKAAIGSIALSLRQEGNDVAIDVADDGAGLDLRRIRDKAQARGLLAADAQPSESALAELIFAPGFSTASELTELAGRGVGLDVVRSEVQAAGGQVAVHSLAGQGLRFTLTLPLTTAVTQVLSLRAGTLTIGVPATVVEVVRRATVAELDAAYAAGSLPHGGAAIPFFWCGALLQSSQGSREPVGRTRPVVVVRSAQQMLALHVDEVLGQQEVVIKNLGPQLAGLPGLSAMTVLPSGAVLPVYNPVALLNVYGDRIRAGIAAGDANGADASVPAVDAVALQPLVLVVDDSITVRRVTQRLLRREGYRVALAVDGMQALERLREERPALVLSDIEMPRMDGFDLLRQIRAEPATASLPVVMITSRIAAKHRDHAMSLGASHYLGKPYPEDELLALVRRHASAEMSDQTSDDRPD